MCGFKVISLNGGVLGTACPILGLCSAINRYGEWIGSVRLLSNPRWFVCLFLFFLHFFFSFINSLFRISLSSLFINTIVARDNAYTGDVEWKK